MLHMVRVLHVRQTLKANVRRRPQLHQGATAATGPCNRERKAVMITATLGRWGLKVRHFFFLFWSALYRKLMTAPSIFAFQVTWRALSFQTRRLINEAKRGIPGGEEMADIWLPLPFKINGSSSEYESNEGRTSANHYNTPFFSSSSL